MNAYIKAASTRKVTDELRDMAHYGNGAARRLEGYPATTDTTWRVELRIESGRRVYLLGHDAYMMAGISARVDTSSMRAWVRPAVRTDGSMRTAHRVLREMAAETLLMDALLKVLEAEGYELVESSETRESLAAWRESRRHG